METSKREALRHLFREMESVLVTLSGGIDSTLLVRVAVEELGDRAAALTAVSPSLARAELEEARKLAEEIGIRHLLVETHEMENPDYTANPSNRCFYCKSELFEVAVQTARKEGYRWVVEGTHAEDLNGHRPGYQAAKERGVRSPLVELEFTKEEIRRFAQDLGISIWDKPSLACLSSRFPTGTEITVERLREIDKVERILHEQGLRQCRARYHGTWLRLEVSAEEFVNVARFEVRREIDRKIRDRGFERVLLDLVPYGEPRGNSLSLPMETEEARERAGRSFQERTGVACEVEVMDGTLAFRLPADRGWEWLTIEENRRELCRSAFSMGFRHVTADLAAIQEEVYANLSGQ